MKKTGIHTNFSVNFKGAKMVDHNLFIPRPIGSVSFSLNWDIDKVV